MENTTEEFKKISADVVEITTTTKEEINVTDLSAEIDAKNIEAGNEQNNINRIQEQAEADKGKHLARIAVLHAEIAVIQAQLDKAEVVGVEPVAVEEVVEEAVIPE